jgi:DNA polymerase-3 subunit alpha
MNMHTEYADRKNGRKPVGYPHPATKPFLESTFGIITYQEQVMQLARDMAGYSASEADDLRKAMGKKIKSVMDAQKEKFVAGCIAQGHPPKLGKELWDSVEPFAGYGFNLSHSACYAFVALQTAYLKAHYPAEYMAALLTSTKRDKDRTALYLSECRTIGVEVQVPDVNESLVDFNVADGKIRFGMSAVRNVGEAVVEKIVAARSERGRFEDFPDFCENVDIDVLNKRTIESLIKAGAFDSLGYARKGLLLKFEEIIEAIVERRRNEEAGQFSLFGGAESEVSVVSYEVSTDEWGQRTKLAFEKEMLGLFISDHPLLSMTSTLRAAGVTPILGLWDMADGSNVTIGGVISGVTRRYTKNGDPMLFFRLEDLESGVEVACFPKTVAQYAPMVAEDGIVLISGRLDHLRRRAPPVGSAGPDRTRRSRARSAARHRQGPEGSARPADRAGARGGEYVREAVPRPGRRQRAVVPRSARRAAQSADGAAADGEAANPARPAGDGDAACAASFLRNASAGERRRPPLDPGAAGTRQPVDHTDLYRRRCGAFDESAR